MDPSNILFQIRFYISIYYIDILQTLHKGPWMSNDSYRTRLNAEETGGLNSPQTLRGFQ